MLAMVRFESPGYLVLLALLPLLVVFSFRSLAGLGPVRRWIAIFMRCLVVGCMIFALAGAEWARETDAVSVVFLVDRSRSIPRDKQPAEFAFLQAAQPGMKPTKDSLGVIAFDGKPAVEQLPRHTLEIARISEPIDPDETNIAAAMRMGLALFTKDARRRLVLVSDGNENVGAALAEADELAAAGVPVDIWPVRYRHANEVVFERLAAPPTARTEETINLQMVLRSQKRCRGRIQLWHNDELIDLDPKDKHNTGYPVALDPGPNRFSIPIPMRAEGAHRFRAVFQPDDATTDTIADNNEGRAFTVVSGQGRILILTAGDEQETGDYRSARILADALEREQLVCDVEIAGEQPLDQVHLLEYATVILSNLSADKLTPDQREALAAYVRDLGGGLVMIGGDESFGAGGWMDTPVEEIMPVRFDVKSKRQIPKGALVLVMHACEIPQGNYWGERVAIAAVKTLSSLDLVGVLSYRWQGAGQGYWVVPFQPVGDKRRVIRRIKAMNMGDMPDFDPVMRPGVDALVKRPDAAVRHMIVISDFDPAAPRSDLLRAMKAHNITCSTVAIGWGGHPIRVELAKRIAKETGGRYYTTSDYGKLPQIFIKESRIVRRSLINENPFRPQLASVLPTTVAGLEGEALPELDGYVVTTAKPLAEVPLVRASASGETDPVLAQWQVGLGKAVAFTSGMWTRWGVHWAAWPKFSKFWAQVVRWVSRQPSSAAFEVTTTTTGGKGRIRIDALDKNAAAINFMNIEGVLVRPDQSSQPLRLTQVGPGVYEGEFDARAAGSYVASFRYRIGRGAEAVVGTLQTGLSVAYSPEYRQLETNLALLRELADRTDGRILTKAEAAAAFDRAGLPPARSLRPLWEYLIRWMLLLFLLDVAVRRIAINPVELVHKLRRRIAEMGGARQPSEGSAAVLSTLKGARERLREQAPAASEASEAGPAPDRSARYEPAEPDRRVTERLSEALGGASELDQPVVARAPRKKPQTSQADFTSRLLKAKRRAREAMENEPKDGGEKP